MKNNRNTVTQTLLKSKKGWLYACLGLTALSDWVLFFVLLSARLAFVCLLFPMLLALLGTALFAAVYFSGLRFRYGLVMPVVYAVVTLAAALAVLFWKFSAPPRSVMTDVAAWVFAGYRGIVCLAILGTAWYSSGRGKVAAFFTAVLGILFFAATGYYAYRLGAYGLFGQGVGKGLYGYTTRTLVYEYDEASDSYEAVDVLGGRGGTVVIPETFNSKKVGSVNYSIFADTDITSVRIESREFSFTGENFPAKVNEQLLISFDRALVDPFRLDLYREGLSSHGEAYFELANRMVPITEEGEIYLAFNYTESSFARAEGVVLPTRVEKAGTVFRLSDYENIGYVLHADNTSEYDRCWSYTNMDGCIFRAPADEAGVPLEGRPLNGSVLSSATFGQVCRVKIDDDNDEVYETENSFKHFEFDGEEREYRYVIAEDADALLEELPQREGFTLSWEYENGPSRTPFESLSAVLGEIEEPVLHPVWKLRAPEIRSVSTDAQANHAVYGEAVTFSGSAAAPVSGATLTYEWRYGGASRSSDSSYSIEKALPAQTGSYTFVVKAAAPALTSLTSEAERSIELTVTERIVRFNWTLPADLVYSGTEKSVSAAPNPDDVARGDSLTCTLTRDSVRDAGHYTVGVSLSREWEEFYEIETADRSRSFDIAPRSVNVTWNTPAFVYTGGSQCPTATANGVGEDGALEIVVTGGRVHAGKDYPAHASIEDPNYTLANGETTFSIAQKEITAVWESGRFTYDGTMHGIAVTSVMGAAEGEEGEVLAAFSYTGEERDASDSPYTMSATIPSDGNYVFAGERYTVTATFTVSAAPLTLVWEKRQFVYDGLEHEISAEVRGAVRGEEALVRSGLLFEGSARNAGGHVMTARLDSSLTNYTLSGDTTCSFEITAKELTVSLTAVRKTYDGKPCAQFTFTHSELGAGDSIGEVFTLTYGGAGATAKDVGHHLLTAQIAQGEKYDNYHVTVTDSYVDIVAAEVTLTWPQQTVYEADGSVKTFEAEAHGILGADGDVHVEYKYYGADNREVKEPKEAGKYTVRAELTGEGKDNYTLKNAESSFEIVSPAEEADA